MASNKYLIEDKSTLLKNKLTRLSSELASGNSQFETQEQVISEVIRIIESFYKEIDHPIFTPTSIQEGDLPDADLYNKIWNQILDDLSIVFSELENLESLTLNNFNFVATETSRLLARLKNVSSSLGDYILYSTNPTRDAFYFKDSFNDLSRIDSNSLLLNKPQCYVDQDQGIVTLPIDVSKESIIKTNIDPVLNNSSNGTVGNNQQIGASYNGDPKVILDNNPDTWFEYEKVVGPKDKSEDPLILDITINLGTEQVVNYIRINPNNFGTKTSIIIDRIETSLDGKVYLNVKDDIPIGDFLTKDEENVFILAPSTSKYAGQGIYTFTPRLAKYVHFVFKQTEGYSIKTPTGDKLRYAIGLRDIDIRGIQYLPEGEIISKEYSFVGDEEIRKVALDANQNPTEESLLASIKYFLSPDNGQTWTEIRPKSFEGFANEESTVREIVDFNGSDENTINTNLPVTSLRLKAELVRNNEAFVPGVSTFRQEVKSTSEIHKIPDGAPFELELEQPPVEGTIEVIEPHYGSRGREDSPYVIGHAGGSDAQISTYYLPFSSFKQGKKKVLQNSGLYRLETAPMNEWIHFAVGGEEWTAATAALSTYSADYSTDTEFRLFRFNPNRGVLYFGNGINTMKPPIGQPIVMWMDEERLYPSEVANSHVAKLDFKTTNDKSQFDLFRYEAEQPASQVLPRKASVIRLEHKNITDLGSISTVLSLLGFTSQVTFVNGRDELSTTGRWSIDTEEGVIYLSNETPSNVDRTIDYRYEEEIKLSSDQWDWSTDESVRDSIVIKDEAWITIHEDDNRIPVTEGTRVIDLEHFAIVKGTLELEFETDEFDSSEDPLLKEVPFIDGIREFGYSVQQAYQGISSLTTTAELSPDNVAVFDLKLPITSDTNYRVTFRNTKMFIQESDSLSTVGNYKIDRDPNSPTYKRVSVRLSSIDPLPDWQTTGTVTYYFNVPNYTTTGLYSVDYKFGRIYMQRPIPAVEGDLLATYQYTDYRAEYNIARVVPPSSYIINRTDRLIKIKDLEILKRNSIPHGRIHEQLSFYQVTYDYVSQTRNSVEALRDYFTPVLKDYVLKTIPKRNLI